MNEAQGRTYGKAGSVLGVGQWYIFISTDSGYSVCTSNSMYAPGNIWARNKKYFPSMYEVLGSILSTDKEKNETNVDSLVGTNEQDNFG